MLQSLPFMLFFMSLLPIAISVALFFVFKRFMNTRTQKPSNSSKLSAMQVERKKNFDRALHRLDLDKQEGMIGESEYEYYLDKLRNHYQPLLAAQSQSAVVNKLSSAVGIAKESAAERVKGRCFTIAFILLFPVLAVLGYWLLVYKTPIGEWVQINQQVADLSQKLMDSSLSELSQEEQQKVAKSNLTTLDMARVLQAKLEHTPESADGWMQLGSLYETASGDSLSNLAYQAYEKAYDLSPLNSESIINFARVNIATGQFGKADTLLRRVLADNSNHESALLMSGFSYYRQKKFELAISQWQRVLTVRPEDSQSRQIIEQQIDQAKAEIKALGTQWLIPIMVNSDKLLPAGAFLFIFAKAEDSSAPVAVQRLATAQFPMMVNLSDANAMMSSRKLSNYDKVTINAFISLTGNPMDKSGGQSQLVTVTRNESKLPVQLVLNQ